MTCVVCVDSVGWFVVCLFVAAQGNYVKDMTRLGRPIEGSIIVDNSPASYLFQPENAIPCESFIENPADRELLEMCTPVHLS